MAWGTNLISSPATLTAAVRARSSLRADHQYLRTSMPSKVSLRIAVAPPQANPLRLSAADTALPAFHTLATTDHTPPRGTSQRYPVLAPVFRSSRGATRR